MTSKEYKSLKELDGFLNELRILLYDKFYKKEIDEIPKSLDKDTLNDSVDNILNKPMFETDISQENKSFKKEYRLRKDTGKKLSISLKQYEGFTLNILAIINDYERERKIFIRY